MWAIVKKMGNVESVVTLEDDYDVAVEIAYRYNYAYQTDAYRVERMD